MARATSRPRARYSADAAGLGAPRAAAFIAPAMALIAVFLVFPALWVIYLGLTNYRLTGAAAAEPQFVGLDNFVKAVADGGFWNSAWLTVQFVLGSAVIGQVVLGFTIAWLLRDRQGPLKRVVEGLVILAWILPGAVVSFLWIALLDRDGGTLNALLGIPGFPWLLDHPMLSIIIFNTWRGTAFSMMLYGAALGNVPPSHLESARLAGASGWQQLRDVVFPHIRGHILTNLLLISLWTFNDFTPFLLTAGGPDHKSEVLAVHVYNVALRGGELGFGAAVSTIILLINLVVAVFYLRLLRRRS
ncbi:sugar ABC transporter permease [Nonomuraea africana]|uniref:Multiple sugar transport system permease protein n=1 Tax=Nonomuraea africana TaxID=46171 RepID=A0ABR9KXZ5_9ACTN|nr:sugar ABC transporter permease [Nonomuraea africana]MBE1566427.1 multiple sugar transport system permease protein [Nonomuraea africana]